MAQMSNEEKAQHGVLPPVSPGGQHSRVSGPPAAIKLRKASKALIGTDNEKKILDYAQAWRPWRGYAGMHLWRYAAVLKQ